MTTDEEGRPSRFVIVFLGACALAFCMLFRGQCDIHGGGMGYLYARQAAFKCKSGLLTVGACLGMVALVVLSLVLPGLFSWT